MGIFSFFRFWSSAKPPGQEIDPNEYVPSFWDDDFLQIEVIPKENIGFVNKQIGQIEDLSAKSNDGFGFTEIFVRDQLPAPTRSKEIRVDYLETTLLRFQFVEAKHISFDGKELLNCETGDTKALGFNNFTVFFETEGEFVKNIWLGHNGLIVSVEQLKLIQAALYVIGEECEFVLVDWNSSELFDLADKTQIEKYLSGYFK